jgi:hypothetical protein
MSELVATLRQELSMLEAELRADPRSIKIAHIRELIAVYEREGPAIQEKGTREPVPESEPARQPEPAHINGSGKTKASLMEETIAQMLLRNGQMHRSLILDHLTSLGIMGHEKKPMEELAVFLSTHRDRFVSDGKGNFRLVGMNAEGRRQ